MIDTRTFTFADPAAAPATAEAVRRFIDAFQRKDASAIPALVAPDCIMEAMQPAPDGLRVEGHAANVAFWQAMVKDPAGSFEVEEVLVCGEYAVNRWRYRFGAGDVDSVRGVTLFRVRDGQVAEALGYAKTPAVSDLGQGDGVDRGTAEVIRRYNEVFLRHDPSALAELVAPDCVIENTSPAPDGSRHVGREACLALWRGIATAPGTRFDIEDVAEHGEQATIRWRLHWGEGQAESERGSVRGVNLMRVRGGRIVEARGYVKGA